MQTGMCTVCVLSVYCMRTVCVLNVYCMCTDVYCLCTICVLCVYYLCTVCAMYVPYSAAPTVILYLRSKYILYILYMDICCTYVQYLTMLSLRLKIHPYDTVLQPEPEHRVQRFKRLFTATVDYYCTGTSAHELAAPC